MSILLFTFASIIRKTEMTYLNFNFKQLVLRGCEGIVVTTIYDLIKYLVLFLLAL